MSIKNLYSSNIKSDCDIICNSLAVSNGGSVLDYYQEAQGQLTLSGPWGVTTYPIFYRVVRLGSMIVLEFAGLLEAASVSAPILSTALPSWAWPDITVTSALIVTDNDVQVLGHVTLTAAGVLQVYAAAPNSSFANTNSCGYLTSSISYCKTITT